MYAFVVCATLALLAGTCSASPATTAAPPDRDPDIEGLITSVEPLVPRTGSCVERRGATPEQPVSSDDPPPCTERPKDAIGGVLVEGTLGGGCGIGFGVSS